MRIIAPRMILTAALIEGATLAALVFALLFKLLK